MEKTLSVLIVEDTDWQLQVYKKLVNALGHVVIVAKNGASGLQTVVHYPQNVDAVICDVQMGPGDGLYFVEQLGELLVKPPPVLLHSGSSSYPRGSTGGLVLSEFAKKFNFVEFWKKDDNNSYIEDFLKRVATSVT